MRFMKSLSLVVLGMALALGLSSVGSSKVATDHQHIKLPGRRDNNPYSNAVLVGDTLYLAGSIGLDPQTGRPPESVEI